MIVIDDDDDDDDNDDDDEEEEEETEESKCFVNEHEFARAASVATSEKVRTTLKYKALRERTSRRNIESRKTTETSAFASIRADEPIEEGRRLLRCFRVPTIAARRYRGGSF